VESGSAPHSPRRRAHLTARDWAQSIFFLAAVVVWALAPLLVLLLVFSLFFNQFSIHLTMFVAGLAAFLHGFTEYRSRLSVSGTATATASSAAIGLVELCGRGYAENPSEAPVTNTPCAFWRVEVRHRGTNDFRWVDGLWHRVMERSSGPVNTLVLEDDTGRILVWARGAETIPVKQVWRSDRGADPPDGVLRLVAALGLQWPSRASRYPIKVTEERLDQGGPLYVMGTLAERRQIAAEPAGWFVTLLDKWAPPSPDAPRQETIASFSATFDAARKVGLRWFAKDFRPMRPFYAWSPPEVGPHQVLVWKGDQRRPFIISGLLERQALAALSRRAWLYLLGGGGVMAWMLWEFLEKLAGNMHW
jgi:hypothetical protein